MQTFGGTAWTAISQASPFLQHIMPVPSGLGYHEFPSTLFKPKVDPVTGIPVGDENLTPSKRRRYLRLHSPSMNQNLLRRLAKWRTLANFFIADFWDIHGKSLRTPLKSPTAWMRDDG